MIKRETRHREWEEEKSRRENENDDNQDLNEKDRAKFFTLKQGVEFKGIRAITRKQDRSVHKMKYHTHYRFDNFVFVFTLKKKKPTGK